jgi:hypothetical protein
MATDIRVDRHRNVAGGDLVVGVAEPRGDQLDGHLALLRVVELDLSGLVGTWA